jgi:hypothetical protein
MLRDQDDFHNWLNLEKAVGAYPAAFLFHNV